MVLDRPSVLGLRADSHEYVLRRQSARLRLRPGPAAARYRNTGERQHRPSSDLADQPEEQALGATTTSRPQHAITGRSGARFSPTPRTCRTFRSTISRPRPSGRRFSSKLLFEAAAGNMTETWTREPVEDSQTSTGYPVTEQTTGINFRAYSAQLLAQLHVVAIVSSARCRMCPALTRSRSASRFMKAPR